MAARAYRLGKRQASVDRTHARILAAGRELVSSGSEPTLGAIAERAGVSRITIYNRFGSLSGLLAALRPGEPAFADLTGTPREQLQRYAELKCTAWARDPGLYRNLPSGQALDGMPRALAERMAAADELRPGCSLKEAADVISALTSFPVFDRLHNDGRRSPHAVAEILMRLAAGILAYHQ